MNTGKMLRLWGPVVAWAGLIFYLSNIPGLKTDLDYDFLLRKMAHITEYFILTFLLYRAFNGSFNVSRFGLFLYPSVLSIFYAASDEFHQLYVSKRHGCIQDVLIDSIGVFGFLVFLRIFLLTRKS